MTVRGCAFAINSTCGAIVESFLMKTRSVEGIRTLHLEA